MSNFADLFKKLDSTSSINEKVELLSQYFKTCNPKDAVWVLALFTGRRPKGIIKSSQLRQWAAEYAEIPLWLLEECYHIVGDLAETTSKILPFHKSTETIQLHKQMEMLLAISTKTDEEKKEMVVSIWNRLDIDERFVFNKLLTGGFRTGISQRLIARGLSKAFTLETNKVLYALSGNWNPKTVSLEDILTSNPETDNSKPYPFCLANSFVAQDDSLDFNKLQIEWKFDGIRAQIIKRNGKVYIWSRGEELFTQKFPEIVEALSLKSFNGVLDGEILVWNHQSDLPESFSALQKRIGTKKPNAKLIQQHNCIFMAYDILEKDFEDIRIKNLNERRKTLEDVIKHISCPNLKISPLIPNVKNKKAAVEIRIQAREIVAEGIMLKEVNSVYETGRKKGAWWKWKIDPMTFDGVMIYAQRGHGRRANLYSDFTFAVKFNDTLVPVAKAYSGLTDAEMKEINQFIKANTIQSFGPVRSVKASLVFEIAFEGIQKSTRHKSGIAVRFPRISRWRKDKTLDEIDTLENLEKLI